MTLFLSTAFLLLLQESRLERITQGVQYPDLSKFW